MCLRWIRWTAVIVSIWPVHVVALGASEPAVAPISFPEPNTRVSFNADPGGGLLGEYFSAYRCHGVPTLTRIDPTIDFDWAGNRPEPPIHEDYFSVRWSGYLTPLYTETYTLIARTTRCVELSIADKQIIWVLDGAELQGKVDLVAREMYPIEITYECAHHGDAIQLLWESPSQPREVIPVGVLTPPLSVSHPFPAQGATEVLQDVTLQWTMGARATHHDIYLGVDANAVAQATTATAGIYRGRQTRDAITFTPGPLEWDRTHYWRIDEVNDAHPESPWKGPIWQFTTADFLLVDDFEDDEDDDNLIYDTWIDGWDVTGNGTGSIVGYYVTDQLPVVHHGRESMRIEYNNVSVPYYSEADRTWSTARDWNTHNLTHLSIWVKGGPAPLLVKPDGNVVLGVLAGYPFSASRFGYKLDFCNSNFQP